MIRVHHVRTGRRGTIRMALLGIMTGAAMVGAVALYMHQARACLNDAQIAEYMRGDQE